ncbi:MAG TPA: histidine phosphatase family protein [Jatrophihabitans sp.]|jgi:probable phosphoglycerate mutase
MTEAAAPVWSAGPSVSDGLSDSTQIWLIRHGETEWSKSGQHTGRTDLPLLPEGEGQASALRGLLADLNPVLVLASPRQRAQRTAELAGLRVDAIDENLCEWDYGDYEGLTSTEIRREVPDWTIWTHGVRGGESVDDVGVRADRVIARIIPYLDEGPVVLVAHGHISRIIGARWIGLPPSGGGNLLLGTAAPSVLGSQYGLSALQRWNMPNPYVAGGGA